VLNSKIAVLGGGPGSLGTAGDIAIRGGEVHFWGRNVWKLAGYFQFKQIKMAGAIEGTAQLAGASDDLSGTLKGARLIVICLPGFTHRDIAERCAPFLENGQIVLICGNSVLSSLLFAKTLKEKGVNKDIICADYAALPVGGRWLESGVVNAPVPYHYKSPGVVRKAIGVFPARRTDEAMEVLFQVYPGIPVMENALACGLIAEWPTAHPIQMLLNTSVIENIIYTDILEEGSTQSVARLIRIADDERKAVQKAWGYKITESMTQARLEGKEKTRDWRHQSSGRPQRDAYIMWSWKDRLDMQHRYITESIPCGCVPRASAATKAGLKVPIMGSLISICSGINGEDYSSIGRSLENLGLGNMNVEQVNSFLYEGYR